MRRVAVTYCAAVLLLLAVPGRSEAPASGPLAAYEQLHKLQFSAPIPVPTGGLQWRIADAAVSLESGNVRVMEPLPDGTVTGVVFEGKGRLTIDVADPVERAQLRRFARKAIDRIDTAFSQMVRTMLRNKTTSDELFIKILSDFAIQYDGKAASTADFRRIVEKDAPGDWRWFFREWIDEADIPTYEWRHSEEAMPDGKYKVSIDLKRSGVRDDFIMPIPIDIELPDGKVGRITIVNKAPEQTVTQIVSGKPRGVTFNPEYAVLAYVKGR